MDAGRSCVPDVSGAREGVPSHQEVVASQPVLGRPRAWAQLPTEGAQLWSSVGVGVLLSSACAGGVQAVLEQDSGSSSLGGAMALSTAGLTLTTTGSLPTRLTHSAVRAEDPGSLHTRSTRSCQVTNAGTWCL